MKPQTNYPSMHLQKKKLRIGKMLIQEQLLLDWLQFPKAKIRGICSDWVDDGAGIVSIILEDREMPELKEGDTVKIVSPVYIVTYSKQGKISGVKRQRLGIK